MTRYLLPGGVVYEVIGRGKRVRTTFPDGVVCEGEAQYGEEHWARALALGYVDGRSRPCVQEQMTADHDLLHTLVAHAVDGEWSHALRHQHDGVTLPGRIPMEERLVFLVTRAMLLGRRIIDENAQRERQ